MFKTLLFAILLGGPQQLLIGSGIIPLGATASPNSVSASCFGPCTTTTPTTTVTATGGNPGYTYAWTWASGGTGITITGPTGVSTAFSAHLSAGATLGGTALCTVTDSASNTTTTTVGVSLTTTN